MTLVMRMRYCIVPSDLAHIAPLVERAWDGGTVLVESRIDDRRSGGDRRCLPGEKPAPEAPEAPGSLEARRMPVPDGRRVAERRVVTIPAPAPELDLPRRARRHLHRLQWVEALPVPERVQEDQELSREMLRIRGGDETAVNGIYEAYVDRAYRYLQLVLGEGEEAEAALGRLFSRTFEAVGSMDPRPGVLRRWLGRELREVALRHADPTLTVDEVELPDRETDRDPELEEAALGSVGDRDLAFFIQRLPSPQREVLLLRDVVGLELHEIAGLVSRTPSGAAKLYGEALALLGERLVALDRHVTGTRHRLHMRSVRRPARVLTGRRGALAGIST